VGRDPVCGMNIDEDRSGAAGHLKEYQGKTYFFCSPECRDEFVKTPGRYLSSTTTQRNMSPAKTKAKDAVDHTVHGVMKRAEPDGMNEGPHKHEGMKMAMPKDPGPTPLSPGTAPIQGEKEGVPFPPASRNPVPMMPGSADGMSGPGLPRSASMPPQMPGGMLPMPADAPMRQAPGQTNGTVMPGAPGAVIQSEPKPEKTDRPTSRPPRRRGAGPLDGAVMPGAREGASVPQSKGDGMIAPGASPGTTDRQTKAPGDGPNHD
jgi:YHS domain-containing protein